MISAIGRVRIYVLKEKADLLRYKFKEHQPDSLVLCEFFKQLQVGKKKYF